jgi:hypothetical protein
MLETKNKSFNPVFTHPYKSFKRIETGGMESGIPKIKSLKIKSLG